jgi:hypothetical protein
MQCYYSSATASHLSCSSSWKGYVDASATVSSSVVGALDPADHQRLVTEQRKCPSLISSGVAGEAAGSDIERTEVICINCPARKVGLVSCEGAVVDVQPGLKNQ